MIEAQTPGLGSLVETQSPALIASEAETVVVDLEALAGADASATAGAGLAAMIAPIAAFLAVLFYPSDLAAKEDFSGDPL